MEKKTRSKLLAILKLLVLFTLIFGIPIYIVVAHHDVITSFNSIDEVRHYILDFGPVAAISYIFFQVAQIIVSFLPGELFQIAAGFIFGFLPGLLLSVIGSVLGSCLTFWIARLLGKDALFVLFGKEKSQKWMQVFQSRKAYIFTMVVYLIPGTPKDVLCYLAGISDMKFLPYIVISNTARIPAMCISLLFGKMLLAKNYTFMIAIAVAVVLILLLMVIFRKKIDSGMDRFLQKFN